MLRSINFDLHYVTPCVEISIFKSLFPMSRIQQRFRDFNRGEILHPADHC